MKAIKLYKVLHTTGINDFHDMVRQHIKNGWITQGGLSVVNTDSNTNLEKTLAHGYNKAKKEIRQRIDIIKREELEGGGE